MRKKILVGFGIVLIAVTLFFSDLINIVLMFLIAGVVPGTHIITPYWLMMAIYCALISLIATPYLERIAKIYYNLRHPAKKPTQASRRRYSHI